MSWTSRKGHYDYLIIWRHEHKINIFLLKQHQATLNILSRAIATTLWDNRMKRIPSAHNTDDWAKHTKNASPYNASYLITASRKPVLPKYAKRPTRHGASNDRFKQHIQVKLDTGLSHNLMIERAPRVLTSITMDDSRGAIGRLHGKVADVEDVLGRKVDHE